MLSALEKFDLRLIGQYYQSFEKDFEDHITNYESCLRNLAGADPMKIDAQTGKDYFSFEENQALFDLAGEISRAYDIPIAHETHRNKALFAAHTTKEILLRVPDLPITADFSHWCAVAESLLEDQQDAVELACKHAIHIHARVGYEEGPQVNDPRAVEWERQLNAHLQWWDDIIAHQRSKGTKVFTITPEFGPAPYMQALPYSREPVANQWDINVYIMQILKDRYRFLGA